MNPWSALVEQIERLIHFSAGGLGGQLGAGILAVAFLTRLALIPITLPLAVRTRARQKVVDRIRPEIQAVKREHRGDPVRIQEELKSLHERNGISLVDGPGAIGALIQLPLLIALFQAVLHVSEGTELASGGLFVGLAASGLSVFSVKAGGQGSSKVLVWLSAVLPVAIALWLGRGIALYLLAFYGASSVQGILMRRKQAADPAGSG